MKQLVSQKLSDLAASEIVAYITREKIVPGQKIPSEKYFSEYFGISRPSVREGMSRLMSVGLLHAIQGYGIVLNEITVETYFDAMQNSLLTRFISLGPSDVESIIDARLLIEQHACSCYLASGEAAELDGIRRSMEAMAVCLDNPVKFRDHDLQFHQGIVNLSHNQVVSHLYALLRAPVEREIELLIQHDDLGEVQKWHERIMSALEEKDDRVIGFLRTHLLNAFPRWLVYKEDRE